MARKPLKATNQRAAASILQKEMRLSEAQAKDLVKRAKDGGCAAFDERGCIDMAVLKKWIGDNKDVLSVPAPMSLKDQKLNEEIRKLKIVNDQKERLVVSKVRGASVIQQIQEAINVLIEQKLENEYPVSVAGLDVPGARVYGKRLGDSLREEFRKLGALWAKL